MELLELEEGGLLLASICLEKITTKGRQCEDEGRGGAIVSPNGILTILVLEASSLLALERSSGDAVTEIS